MAQRQKRRTRKAPCIAVIGDMIQSRELARAERSSTQREFNKLIADINRQFRPRILASFVITLGDEFQGLLHDGTVIPALIRRIEQFSPREFRLGIGFGTIDTAIQKEAINVDGPALHNARAAIDRAKKKDLRGGVFVGFGSQLDRAANGYARILRHLRDWMTQQQRRVLDLLSSGLQQSDVAKRMKISKQAVSQHAAAVGWPAYRDAEVGWSALFERLAGRNVP